MRENVAYATYSTWVVNVRTSTEIESHSTEHTARVKLKCIVHAMMAISNAADTK
jgi:hypothetical protein